jgi:5'-3' exonuclease
MTVKSQLDDMMHEILRDVPAKFKEEYPNIAVGEVLYTLYLKGDGKNYRRKHCKTVAYKAHRPEKPANYDEARKYLGDKYFAVYANGQETDDLIGIVQTKLTNESSYPSIIVSKDKDFLTIPGFIYNSYHKTLVRVSPVEADRNFYTQILTGDRADNIKGLDGVGPVKAKAILKEARNSKEMLLCVLGAFESRGHSSSKAAELVDELGKLLYIRRRENEIWSVKEVLR